MCYLLALLFKKAPYLQMNILLSPDRTNTMSSLQKSNCSSLSPSLLLLLNNCICKVQRQTQFLVIATGTTRLIFLTTSLKYLQHLFVKRG